MIDLADIEAAASRIAPMVRRTPMIRFDKARQPFCANDLFLKLECLQPTGSFKVRGASNKLLTTPKEVIANGIVTASGGNHGLAVARAAAVAGIPATIFVPKTVTEEKLGRLKGWGADVRIVGQVFDEAKVAALALAEERGLAFFHPFADPAVVAGQGTVGLEILADLPDVDVIVIAIGGGGLMAGIATAIKALKPEVRLVGVEPEGSPTLHDSLQAGNVVCLPKVSTRVATMACGETAPGIFEIVRNAVDHVALISDEEMMAAARRLWEEIGLAADLSGAAALAGLASGRIPLRPGETVCALVCGAGSDIFHTPA